MSVNKPEPVIILLHEGVLQSWATDAMTFSWLAFLPWFNHRFCGGSAAINVVIALCWFISISVRAVARHRMAKKTPTEARAYLDEHYPVVKG